MNVFDMVPDNFFSMLSSKNKRLYVSCILQAFKIYETGSILGIDKKIIVDDLIYYLDTHQAEYTVEEADQEDEEADPKNKRELANFVLRRMEETGWIYVDVSNDYEEVLNYTDMGITICEALLRAYPSFEYDSYDDYPENYIDPTEYQGYIFSIYSILKNSDQGDYDTIFAKVFSDTKQLIRAIRRLDARMKEYIQFVIEHTEIKDLIERLITYKTDVYDRSYMKLKVSDNISRFRLEIITKLKELQNDERAVRKIANNYLHVSKTIEEAEARAVRNIDEVIDAFNAIEDFIKEIDNKNRNYINSTIGKIKFLLSEEDNVIGKINRILKHIKDSNKNNKIDKAMRLVDGLYSLRSDKVYSPETSLYTPRGKYVSNQNNALDDIDFNFEMDEEFINQFKTAYNEEYIAKFMESYMDGNMMRASQIIDYETDDSTVMMVVYSVIMAVDKSYHVDLCDNIIDHKKFRLRDFIIRR